MERTDAATVTKQEAAKGLQRLQLRMAQRRGYATVEAWHKAEALARGNG